MTKTGLKRFLNWRLALVIIALAAVPLVSAANLTAAALQPVNNSNITAGSTIGLQVNCSSNTTLTNATAYVFYYENASLYGYYSNASGITNDTNFNISFASPSQELNYTWYVLCEDNASAAVASSNLTFNLLTSYFLTSVLSSPADASNQVVANTISLTGSCESNATLTGGRFWVYRSTGADYANYANTSAITNATSFSVSFTVPIEAATWYWNLQCSDNYDQTANASANYSFVSVSGSAPGSSATSCASHADCASGYYCTGSTCVQCDYGADGICRTCAAELGLIDPDCEEAAPTAEPTTQPTAAPTQEPTVQPTAQPTQEPTIAPTTAPTEEPVEEGVTYGEAMAEIEAAQSMQGADSNEDAQALIGLAMDALDAGDYAQAKAYAEQAQAVLLSAPKPADGEVQSGGFDWTVPVIVLLLVLGAFAYFGTRKKEGL